MNEITKLLQARLESDGYETNGHKLIVAPEFGGDYKSNGLSMRKGQFSADAGEYSTNAGSNYYGYAGVQPVNVGLLSLGGALGAYGNQGRVNGLAGLLGSMPIMNGEARLLLSPGSNGPAMFLGYQKRF